MIYFLQRANGDIKIGTTRNFQMRYDQLRVDHGELKLMGALKGGRKIEKALHEQFAEYKQGRTEWFTLNDELIQYIDTYASMSIPADEMGITAPIRIDEDVYKWVMLLKEAYGVNNISDALRRIVKQVHPDIENFVQSND